MNPATQSIREHLRQSRARRKSHNITWWYANSQISKLQAEIRRISALIARLEPLQKDLERCQNDLGQLEREQHVAGVEVKTEDAFQVELKAKLSEIASAKRMKETQ